MIARVQQELRAIERVAAQLVEMKKKTSASNLLVNFPLWNVGEVLGFRTVLNHLREAGIWTPPAERGHAW